jgi:hypothetical protein
MFEDWPLILAPALLICVADYCGNVHNIRLAIAQSKAESDVERTARKHTEHLSQAIKYLESYAYLICFLSYLWERRYHELEPTAAAGAGAAGSANAATGGLSGPAAPARQQSLGMLSGTSLASATVDTPLAHVHVQQRLPFAGANSGSSSPPISMSITSSSATLTLGSGAAADGSHMHRSPSTGALTNLSHPHGSSASSSTSSSSSNALHSPSARSSHAHTTAAGLAPASALQPFPSFHEWMRGRAELKAHLESFRKAPHEALKLDIGLSDELYTLLYENRNGNVLVRGSILKSDYFKGIHSNAAPPPQPAPAAGALTPAATATANTAGHGLLPASAHAATVAIEGAINFRLLEHFPVAGTGIPSDEGIRNILRYFSGEPRGSVSGSLTPLSAGGGGGSTPSAQTHARFKASGAVWINLRGEPICYLHGKPFVLRDHDNPYLNLEHNGITRRRVEAQEKQLKKDVLNEINAYAGKLFLHDEDDDGNLASYWYLSIIPPRPPLAPPSLLFAHTEGCSIC